MNTRSVLIGAAAGSAVMFILDPNVGRRRRALVRDRIARASRKTRNGLDAKARDMAHRTAGMFAEARGRWRNGWASDGTLFDRVRAKLGRVSSHPHAIRVDLRDGVVTLRGPILASEVPSVLVALQTVRGVSGVNNQLEPHETAAGVPSLQGAGKIAGSLGVLQRHWSPAARALVAAGVAATGVLMANRLRRGSHDWEHQGAVI